MRFRRYLRAAAFALGITPAVAMADPITAVAALAPFIGGTAAAFVVSYGGYILLGAAAAYQSSSSRRRARRAAADAKASYIASLTERNATVMSAVPPWQIVYGRCVVPGTIVAIFHSDKTGTREDSTSYTRPDGYIHYVVEWAHHQCQAVNEVYIDGIAVGPTDGNGNATSGDFYTTKVDSRVASIPAVSFVDVPDPVISIMASYYANTSDGSNIDTSPVLSNGNTRITNPDSHQVVVNYTYQNNRSSVRVNHHLGDSAQTVDTYLNSVRPSEWDANHRGRGATYSVITCDQEDQRFQTGALPIFTADISGKLVYDPRNGSTAWSSNPALCIRDWLTSPWGYNCVSADINDSYTIAAANDCDGLVSIDDGAGPYQAAKFTCNGCFTTESAKESILADFEESMAGHVVYGARWMIQAGEWTTPVTLPGGGGLTDDDLAGQISVVQADTPMDELFNGVRGTYVPATVIAGTGTGYLVNGAHAAGSVNIILGTGVGTVSVGNGLRFVGDDNTYEVTVGLTGPGTASIKAPGIAKALASGTAVSVVSLPKSSPTDIRPPYQNINFVNTDGIALWEDVALPYTNSGGRARNIARILTEKARSGLIIRYPAKLRAIVLQVGDRVNVQSTEYGFDQTFRVTDRQFGLTSPVTLILQEDAAEIYDEADAAEADPTPNTRLPNPWSVQAILGLTALADSTTALTSNLGIVTPRVSVSWSAVTDRYVIEKGYIEILWRVGTQPWVSQRLPGDSTGVYITGPKHDDRVLIEARAVNGLGKAGPSAFYAIIVDAPVSGTAEVFSSTPGSGVTVTGLSHSPDGFGFNTLVASVTFTPKATGKAQVFFDGQGNYTTGGSPGSAGWSIQDSGATYDGWKRINHYVPASITAQFAMTTTRTISVLAGSTYTFGLYANKFNPGDTMTVDNMQMRVEVVRT